MPSFTSLPASTYLGQYNKNVTKYVSIDAAVQNKDIAFSAAGDIENVSGNQKLIQDIMLFLLSPVGTSLIDLSWGNRSLSLLGEAISYRGQVEKLILSSVADLQKFKAQESITRGAQLEASELISSVLGIEISSNNPTDNTIQVLLTIQTAHDDIINISVPLG